MGEPQKPWDFQAEYSKTHTELRAEYARLKEYEKSRATQDENRDKLVQQLLEETAERRAARSFVMKKVVIPVAVLLGLGGGGGAIWAYNQPEDPEPPTPEVQVQETKKAVASEVDDLEKKQALTDKKIQRIVDIQLDQQVQLTDTVDFLGDKIDKISPRAKTVSEDEYPSLGEGRKKAKAIREARENSDVGYDPADPLADLKDSNP